MKKGIHRIAAAAVLAASSAAALADGPPPAPQDEVARLLAEGRREAALDFARGALGTSGDPALRHCYGWALVEAGRAADALPHLQAAANAFPRDARVMNNLGCALLGTGDSGGAAQCFRKAVGLDGAFAAPRNNLGVLLEKAGDRDGAEDSFREALDADARHAQAHNNLGALLYEDGRGAEAMRHFVEAAKAAPAYASPRINMGALALDRGDDTEAEKFLREAAAGPDARAEAHFNLALLGLRRGDMELARTSLEKALALRPEDPDILNNLGVCHLLRRPGEYRKAEGYFQRAVNARAGFAQGWDNLGLSLQFLAVQSGDDPRLLDRAEKAFRKEIELRPDAAFARYNLGTVLVARGKVEEAEEAFRAAIRLAPGHADAHFNLGYCLSMTTPGQKPDPDAELLCYQQAVAADPNFADAHRALAIFWSTTEGRIDLEGALAEWKLYSSLTPTDPEAQKETREAIDGIRKQQEAAKKAPRPANR